jgi:hypothetical protein
LWIFSWATLLTPSSLGLGHKREGKADGSTGGLAWRVDLRSVGFTGFAPKQEQWGLHLSSNPLCFSDNNTLTATFITQQDITTLARRDQPGEALTLRLHAIFLDSEAGKLHATKEWPITRPRGGVIAVGDGRFAVLTPAMIAVYSPNLELVKDFQLSSKQQSDLWDFRSSPSGKSIVAEYHTPDYFQWIDTKTLIPQPTSIPTVVFSISDDDVVIRRNPYIESKGFLSEILIRTIDGSWRTICSVLSGQGDTCGGEPQFLSNEVFALVMPHGFSLLRKTGGDAVLKARFHDDEWIGHPLHPTADGQRFAVTVWAHKGGSKSFDITSYNVLKRIEIYDLQNPHLSYMLDVKERKIKDLSGVALSPDGSLLAILVDGVVEVYQLPMRAS